MSTGTPVRQSILMDPKMLSQRLSNPETASKLRILDATWFMPSPNRRDGQAEFVEGPRIKGAAGFWDVDAVADKTHPLKLGHMMPDAETFARACSELGIARDSEVVVYDTHSVFSSPRTAFTFKAFSHVNVYVLNGGLPRWIAEGLPVEDGAFEQPFQATQYPVVEKNESMIRSYDQMTKNVELESDSAELETVFDARPAGRFTGEAPEPRPGLSSGHMPNSLSLPFGTLLSAPSSTTPAYQTLLPSEELRTTIQKALGEDEDKLQQLLSGQKKVVNSCGSGMTAAILWLALRELGASSAIYDESWTGYAMRPESKIIKGAA